MSAKINRCNDLNYPRHLAKAISHVAAWSFIIHFKVCLIMAHVTPNFEYRCDVTGLVLCFCKREKLQDQSRVCWELTEQEKRDR